MILLKQKQHQFVLYLGIFLSLFSTSAFAADWAWQLESATIFESVVAIQKTDGSLNRYQFQCDLTDTLNEQTEKSSTIETVVPTSHPNGVLIVTCYMGAHAEMLTIVDPIKNKVVYKKIGSYFVDWRLEGGEITIDYDTPCEDTKKKTCAELDSDFVTISQTWP